MHHTARKVLAGIGVAVMAAAVAVPVAAQDASPAASGAAGGSYKIGVSNNAAGNGWREQMICSMKAQALASGEVSSLNVIHRTTDAAGQLADLRTLISDGVNAIVVNPADPEALNPALDEAAQQGIVVVAVDATVTDPNAYILSNDQENYGYLGAKWLFDQLEGKGDVVYMRGIAGVQADTDRDNGFKRALAEYPDIKVVSETFTNWAQADGTQQINDVINSGTHFDGVWTSGIDNVVVDAIKSAIDSGAMDGFVPVVGADNSGFVAQLLDTENYPGLTGAAVTNPGSVGGAGIALALQILDGNAPADKVTHLTPQVWDNVTDEGKAALAAASDPSLDPTWPLGLEVPGWTTYTKDQLLACKGPGEQ